MPSDPMTAAYPEGFFSWPQEQRDAYFAERAADYRARQAKGRGRWQEEG